MTELGLHLALPADLVEQIAQRAADIILERQAAAEEEASRWLTIPQAVKYTGFTRQWFYDARSDGRLTRHGAGRRKAMIDRRELDALIAADGSGT
jgi:hypothetical protein